MKLEEEKLELAVRRAISEEVGKHREFLQNQFKFMTWGIGIIFIAGAIVFNFVVGQSIKDSEEKLTREVDSKVVEYRIVDKFKEKLNEHIQIAVAKAVDSEDTQKRIGTKLNTSVKDLIDQQEKQLQDRINTLVQDQINELPGLDSAALLKKVALPKGAILAFKRTECPDGWKAFQEGSGRFLVGIGNASGLRTKNLLEIGGEDEHVLIIDEIPNHKHETVEAGDPSNSSWGVSGPRNGRHGVRWEHFQTSYTAPVGGSKPHNNLPPYVGVLFCEKL
jgi:hypothetical protein